MARPDLREIPAAVLARLPAMIADRWHVIPFATEGDVLLVAYAHERGQNVAKLRKRLRPSIAGPFALCPFRAVEISEALERNYREGFIHGCGAEWGVCPRQWQALVPTDEAKLRYCANCMEAVRFCESDKEAESLGEELMARERPPIYTRRYRPWW
jgi:hypothetical protein